MDPEQSQAQNIHGYDFAQTQNLMDQLQALRDAQPSIQLDLGVLAEQLTVPRAKTFATQALGRRLAVVERAVLNVFRIFPPDRNSFMNPDECNDVAIQLHAFAINIYALFDNITWICTLEAALELSPSKIGPFNKECQAALPDGLRAYLGKPEIRSWFNDYGKVYRDSTAHRIPPYLPSRVLTTQEVELWKELDTKSMQALAEGRIRATKENIDDLLERHEKFEEEKNKLGRNSLLMALSLTGEDATPPVYLHPQLLCDWGLAHELLLAFTKSLRNTYQWRVPFIPQMSVRGTF
jgi:hypothetical protein